MGSGPEAEDALRTAVERALVAPMPPSVANIMESASEWAISHDLARVLSALVRVSKPHSVLEFGAGRSSLVIADALEGLGRRRLTSVEHQAAYAMDAWATLADRPDLDARLLEARLSVRMSRHGVLHTYVGVSEGLRARAPYDFVFIDGPPGRFGRDATLFSVASLLSPRAVILLDDAARPAEKTAVRRWQRALPLTRVFESDAVGRGVLVLRLDEAKAPGFSLRTWLGTVHDRFLERRHD